MAQADGAMGCVGGHVAQAAQERLVLFLKSATAHEKNNRKETKRDAQSVTRTRAVGGRAVSGETQNAMKISNSLYNSIFRVGALAVTRQPSQRHASQRKPVHVKGQTRRAPAAALIFARGCTGTRDDASRHTLIIDRLSHIMLDCSYGYARPRTHAA